MEANAITLVSEEEELIGTYDIYPAQPIVPWDYPRPWVDPNPTIYGSDSLYPSKLIEIIHNGSMRGARLVKIAVYPLQYRPRTRRLYLVRNLRFEFALSPARSSLLVPQVQSYETYSRYLRLLRNLVKNQNHISSYVQQPRLVPEDELFKMGDNYRSAVVITDSSLQELFYYCYALPLTRKGVGCGVHTVQHIMQYCPGQDSAEKIRNWIKYALYPYGTYYVLLAGDDGIVPFRYCTPTQDGHWPHQFPPPTAWFIPCDLYFSDLSGNWNADNDAFWGEPWSPGEDTRTDSADVYPEVMVGRALVRNGMEAGNFIAKTAYGDGNGGILPELFNDVLWEYDQDGSTPIVPPQYVRDEFPDRFQHHDLPSPYADEAREALDVGYGCVNLYCHGDSVTYFPLLRDAPPETIEVHAYWGGIEHGHDAGLNYMDLFDQPYWVYSVCCDVAKFDVIDTCVADAFTDAYFDSSAWSPTGAVAFLGNTRWGWTSASPLLHRDFLEFFFDSTTCLSEAEAISKINNFSWMPNPPGIGQAPRYVCYSHNLFGCPELEVFTKRPRAFKIEKDVDTIYVGRETTFTVTVKDSANDNPLGSVRVCIYGPGYQIKYTNASGEVSFTVTPEYPGTMTIGCYLPRREDSSQYKVGVNGIFIVEEGKMLAGIREKKTFPKILSITEVNPSIATKKVQIKYGIPKEGKVELCVYNALGVLVKTFHQGKLKPTYYNINWDLRSNSGEVLPSGIYWIVLSQSQKKVIKKLLVIR